MTFQERWRALSQPLAQKLHNHTVEALEKENAALRDALHRISLGAANSGTTKEALGKEARAAIDAARKERV